MSAQHDKPTLSPSYELETGTLAPMSFSKSRLRMICSRHIDQSPVKNLDMVINEQKEDGYEYGNRIGTKQAAG